MAKQLTVNTSETWKQSALADAVAWHRANGDKLTEVEFDAFKAGFAEGWRQLLRSLVAQGYITRT